MPNITVNSTYLGVYSSISIDSSGNIVAFTGAGPAPTAAPTPAPTFAPPVPPGYLRIESIRSPFNGSFFPNGEIFYTGATNVVADFTLPRNQIAVFEFTYNPSGSYSTRFTAGPGNFGDVDRLSLWISDVLGSETPIAGTSLVSRNAPTIYFPSNLIVGKKYYVNVRASSPVGNPIAVLASFA